MKCLIRKYIVKQKTQRNNLQEYYWSCFIVGFEHAFSTLEKFHCTKDDFYLGLLPCSLVTFTEDIVYGKIRFLCNIRNAKYSNLRVFSIPYIVFISSSVQNRESPFVTLLSFY